VGLPPSAEEAVATLVNIASIDRAEEKVKALPRIIAESIGRDINDIYRNANGGTVRPWGP
jgi:magnesium chelatase subunit H